MASADDGARGDTLVGAMLQARYRLTRLIGRGGMGAVYEAVQVPLNKRVAVKVMKGELSANDEALARFRREAVVTSQLGHPHIVQVFDFGETPTGEPYLVMEYLDGEDLEQRLARVGRFTLEAAAGVVRQVASALAETHARGIVHRDLKPANIFFQRLEDEEDFVKVVDFGISKVRMATTKITGEKVVLGTPSYMSPEQANGRIEDIDGRTDEWSLACIVYEMLAGHPPFRGDDMAAVVYQVIYRTPPPVLDAAPELPPEVDQVLGRALSKAQADRFPTVSAFARALDAIATGRSVAGDEADEAPGSGAPAPARQAAGEVRTSANPSAARPARRAMPASGRVYLIAVGVAVSAALALLLLRARGPSAAAPVVSRPQVEPVAPAPARLAAPVPPSSGVAPIGSAPNVERAPALPAEATGPAEPEQAVPTTRSAPESRPRSTPGSERRPVPRSAPTRARVHLIQDL